MRELICTVSGQVAEITKTQTIRISDDRNNHPRDGQAKLLLHSGFGQNHIFQSRSGFSRSINPEGRRNSPVPPQAGYDTRTEASGDGRDSRLTFPPKVKVLIGGVIAVFSGLVVMICLFIRSVMLLKGISLMSGLPWVLGAIAAYALLLLLFVALMKIAAASDRRMAEMGGSR